MNKFLRKQYSWESVMSLKTSSTACQFGMLFGSQCLETCPCLKKNHRFPGWCSLPLCHPSNSVLVLNSFAIKDSLWPCLSPSFSCFPFHAAPLAALQLRWSLRSSNRTSYTLVFLFVGFLSLLASIYWWEAAVLLFPALVRMPGLSWTTCIYWVKEYPSVLDNSCF